jgi:hypothetical protein
MCASNVGPASSPTHPAGHRRVRSNMFGYLNGSSGEVVVYGLGQDNFVFELGGKGHLQTRKSVQIILFVSAVFDICQCRRSSSFCRDVSKPRRPSRLTRCLWCHYLPWCTHLQDFNPNLPFWFRQLNSIWVKHIFNSLKQSQSKHRSQVTIKQYIN